MYTNNFKAYGNFQYSTYLFIYSDPNLKLKSFSSKSKIPESKLISNLILTLEKAKEKCADEIFLIYFSSF